MKKKKTVRGGPAIAGVPLKKEYGQHFLRDKNIVASMLAHVSIDKTTSVFEIGCGDGFLTKELVAARPARLWVFEIDPAWAKLVKERYADEHTTFFVEDILTVDWQRFAEFKPWVLLANLPYQITFPLLHLLAQHANLLREGVIMIQEEVAQRLVATGGRLFGVQTLFFQHVFTFTLLDRVPPSAFYPPPKVYSRLLYFKPRIERDYIEDEEQFWLFIRRCFSQPRRTLKNNLAPYGYNLTVASDEILGLRAQQMTKEQLLSLWKTLSKKE